MVFVDMDGVLADLFNHMAEIHDVDHYNHMAKAQWEEFFRKSDPYHLFADLPPFPTANELLRMVVDIFGGYRILSSPLNFDLENSIAGKKAWLEKNIQVPADQQIFDHEKFKYAVQKNGTPNILIDDWKVNIDLWNQAGGIGVKFQSDENSLDALKKTLMEIRARFC